MLSMNKTYRDGQKIISSSSIGKMTYRGITFTAIAGKVYYATFLKLNLRKFLDKIKTVFGAVDPHHLFAYSKMVSSIVIQH